MRVFVACLMVFGGLVCCSAVGSAEDAAQVRALGPAEKVRGGFQFTEGPSAGADGLYFTDIPANQIWLLRDGGEAEVWVEPSGHANGLLAEAGGRLVACQMDGQVVAYDLRTGESKVLAATYEGQRFNAPNDLVIDAAGGVYFTDPLYRAPQPLPQGVQAVYYIASDGKVIRVTGGLPAPNGVGLSPDGKRLYVVPSQSAEMLVYDVLGPGKLSDARVLCKLRQREPDGNSGGDGMAVDTAGNLYITAETGVQVFSPEGEFLTNLEFPEQPANVTFGGVEGNILFVTARTGLYKMKVSAKGLAPGKLAMP